MEKTYEVTILLHPDLEIDLEKPLKKIEKIIKENGGKVIKQDNWGKRKLAYPIRKQDFAIYIYQEVVLAPTQSNKIQNIFNITDEVLRYLVVEKDLKAPENSDLKLESETVPARTEEASEELSDN